MIFEFNIYNGVVSTLYSQVQASRAINPDIIGLKYRIIIELFESDSKDPSFCKLFPLSIINKI